MVQSSSKIRSFPVSSVWFPTIYSSTLHTSGTLHAFSHFIYHPYTGFLFLIPTLSPLSNSDQGPTLLWRNGPASPHCLPELGWWPFSPFFNLTMFCEPFYHFITKLFYHCTDVLLESSVLSQEIGTEGTTVIKGLLSWPNWLRSPEVPTIFPPNCLLEAPTEITVSCH